MRLSYFSFFFLILSGSSAWAIACRSDCGPRLEEYTFTAVFMLSISVALALFFSRGHGGLGTAAFQKYLTCCILFPAIFVALVDLLARFRTPVELRDDGSPIILFWLVTSLLVIGLHALFVKAVSGNPTRPQKIFVGWVFLVVGVFFYAIS